MQLTIVCLLSKTGLYIQDMLTNRDDEKEATGAYVDAFVSKDNDKVSDWNSDSVAWKHNLLAKKLFILQLLGCGASAKVGPKSVTWNYRSLIIHQSPGGLTSSNNWVKY